MFICTKPHVTRYERTPGILLLIATTLFLPLGRAFAIQLVVALGAQLPVRLDPDTDSRLESIAQRTGTTKSALIRMLAKRFVETCILPDGSVVFPPSIQAMLNERDSRSDTVSPVPPSAPVTYKLNSKTAAATKAAGNRAAAKARAAARSQKPKP